MLLLPLPCPGHRGLCGAFVVDKRKASAGAPKHCRGRALVPSGGALMPEKPIAELFRDFPVEPSETWGPRWLCPDLSTYGVLRKVRVLLCLWSMTGTGGTMTNRASKPMQRRLKLCCAMRRRAREYCDLATPPVSSEARMAELEVIVDRWHAGHKPSLLKAVVQTVQSLLSQLKDEMLPEVYERLRLFEADEGSPAFHKSREFVCKAVLTIDQEVKHAKMQTFLQAELPTVDTELLARKFPGIWGCSIETRMKPTLAWLEDVGLSQGQVAKVIAVFPSVLGLSIEANLKPTVAWLEDVGLSQPQVAKVIAAKPQVLGYSIGANLKPTVAWLEDVGLSQSQVAKVIVVFPSVLGLSIEANLKPTVACA